MQEPSLQLEYHNSPYLLVRVSYFLRSKTQKNPHLTYTSLPLPTPTKKRPTLYLQEHMKEGYSRLLQRGEMETEKCFKTGCEIN